MRVLTDPADTVTISLPQDIQSHAYDYPLDFFKERIWRVERRLPDPSRIQEALALLKSAKRPMIIVGGGVIYSVAEAELVSFAERFGCPVGETMAGKGAMDNAHALSLGGFGVTGTGQAGKLARRADVIISIGSRLTDFTTGSQSAFDYPNVKFISINVSGHDAYKLGALPIVADARETLKTLLIAFSEVHFKPSTKYLEEIAFEKRKWHTKLKKEAFIIHPEEVFNQQHAISVLNEFAQDGDTVIAAAGGLPGDLHQLWDSSEGRACLLEFGNSCMGFEIPGGLGIRMAKQNGEVYVFVGDGTYLMQPSELVTSIQEGLKITVLIAQNQGFQIIRRLQMDRAGISFGNEFRKRDSKVNRLEGDYLKIDFAKNAESMGVKAWSAKNPDEMREALKNTREETCSCVIVIETEKYRYSLDPEVWWDVAAAEVSNDKETQQARVKFEAEKANLQRFYF